MKRNRRSTSAAKKYWTMKTSKVTVLVATVFAGVSLTAGDHHYFSPDEVYANAQATCAGFASSSGQPNGYVHAVRRKIDSAITCKDLCEDKLLLNQRPYYVKNNFT